MKKIIVYILIGFFILFQQGEAFSQFNKSTFISTQQIIPFKLIIGELKGMSGNYEAYYKIVNQQAPEFPYYLIIERDASFCFFLNQHISGLDTNALKYLRFSNAEEKDFYKRLYKLNLTREIKNKIIVRSFDIEYHNDFQTCLNAVYYMIKRVSNAQLQQIADSIYTNTGKPNHIKTKDLFRLIDSTRLADLMVDDSTLQIIKTNLNTSLNFGKPLTKSWYKKREQVLGKLFEKAIFGLQRYCVILQTLHLPKTGNRNNFLKKMNVAQYGIVIVYPIYFNRFVNSVYTKPFYCEHPKNPFFLNRQSTIEFSNKKGAWLISSKKTYYLVISN